MYNEVVCTECRVNSRCSQNVAFLGTFAKLPKATISSATRLRPSVHPSIHPHGTARLPHYTDLHEILCLWIFRKSVEKIQV